MKLLIEWFKKLFGFGNKPSPQPSLPLKNIEQIKQRLLELHNNNRVIPLKRSNKLDNSAQLHNDYMVSTGTLTHDEPGRTLGDRISEQGYNWNYIGENIAMGQNTPEEVMKSWMNSLGHRNNIQNPHFNDVGFGVTNANNIWWWTVNFGRGN